MIFDVYNENVVVFGLNVKKNGLSRLPSEVIEKLPSLSFLGKRPVGGRIAFKTNATSIKIRCELEDISVDSGMSLFAGEGLVGYRGNHRDPLFMGIIAPYPYSSKFFEGEFHKEGYMEDVMIFLGRNEIIKKLEIEIPDNARLEPPLLYHYSKPICYYGSSITEGGCATMVPNSYPAIISRHLDTDYINLGFSGACKAELEMADYINTLDISMLVYDYDHNAPDAQYLQKTHLPFFNRIRSKNKNLPIVLISKPAPIYHEDDKIRRAIIKNTYIEAISNGDRNVYFIDGETLYKNEDRMFCTTDGVHPNDLGFYRMAEAIEPIIRKILVESIEK